MLNCNSCMYWSSDFLNNEDDEAKKGLCKRYPPTVNIVHIFAMSEFRIASPIGEDSNPLSYCQPVTFHDDYCGEHAIGTNLKDR